MSAGSALQATLVGALSSVEPLTGVYDGAPARATFPYLVLDASLERDWSHKTGEGREIAVALALWDDQPARSQRIVSAVEQAMGSLPRVDGWDLISLSFIRKRTVRDVTGPWAIMLDYRARMLRKT